eukprot:CAMPEP_0203654262 /NCGR_PEP_ID=MMETSP0088-20131115/34683_1 /ASSEMBLY_ACC=CAM_ASM_001087 /TAXON_ID=426623 /ORGANISM="Chaetoceros affinis, Strain CCMP159" /LENGTH=89 /DNA_ID=CAMNT_0050514481 /DNA_START=314 /DNA_END=583 /DNA_ORIENTATION=-
MSRAGKETDAMHALVMTEEPRSTFFGHVAFMMVNAGANLRIINIQPRTEFGGTCDPALPLVVEFLLGWEVEFGRWVDCDCLLAVDAGWE